MKKKITLPSGATCVIRMPTAEDYYLAGADSFPDVFVAESSKDPEARAKALSLEAREGLLAVTHRVLLRCVSPITFKDGRRLRLVEKDLDQVNDRTELHLSEFKESDALQDELNKLREEVAAEARPFSEKPQDAAVAGPSGAEIRNDTQPPAENAG